MILKNFTIGVCLLLSAQVAFAESSDYIVPENASLKFGRLIWMNNCESCHAYGVADAPVPMHPGDWKHRAAKGKTLLYQHAIEGFIGEDYSVMPARGGNDELQDEQIKAAVDYMLFLANFYIKKEGGL